MKDYRIKYEKLTLNDVRLISKCAKRAVELDSARNFDTTKLDLEIVHCYCGGLNLNDLLASDESEFMHDVVGIYHHLNRDTLKLTDGFLPRFAQNLQTTL